MRSMLQSTLIIFAVVSLFFNLPDGLELSDRTLRRDSRTFEAIVSDALYLSLWFPDFSGPEMLPHTFAVLQQFPSSTQRPGITYFAVHPISWDEATVLERRFPSGID